MHTVQVLMSTYNGERYIRRQIDSIMAQTGVEVYLLIRDDGSEDSTVSIIQEYVEQYPDRIQIVIGKNIGWEKSFIQLLRMAGNFDYYAFADQDDYWFPDKEICSIKTLEADSYMMIPKLVQINMIYADEHLKAIYPVPTRAVDIKYHDEIYADDFFLGCSMTWNYLAMKLFQQYYPMGSFGHDRWCGVVCYLLGKVYYNPQKNFYYIRHIGNASTVGNRLHGRIKRIKTFISGSSTVYDNLGADLLRGYTNLLGAHDLQICNDFVIYRHCFQAKFRLLKNLKLRRSSLLSTLLFKISILFNRV